MQTLSLKKIKDNLCHEIEEFSVIKHLLSNLTMDEMLSGKNPYEISGTVSLRETLEDIEEELDKGTVILFSDKYQKGTKLRVNKNISNLKDTKIKKNTSSIQITTKIGKALLFEDTKFKGNNCTYFCGTQKVNNYHASDFDTILGDGGKITVGKPASIRMTPFSVKLNVNVFKNENGFLPGLGPGLSPLENRAEVIEYFRKVVDRANSILNRYLLHLKWDNTVHIRTSDKFYNMKGDFVQLLGNFTKKKHVNVYLVNRIGHLDEDTLGIASHPAHSGLLGMTLLGPLLGGWRQQGTALEYDPNTVCTGHSLAHEIGHILALTHITKNKSKKHPEYKKNLMSNSKSFGSKLLPEQVMIMHDTLASNLFRKNLRFE